MVLINKFYLIIATTAFVTLTSGCFVGGEVAVDPVAQRLIPPVAIKGSDPIFGVILDTLGIDLPFSQAFPASTTPADEVKGIYLNAVAVRVTNEKDFDQKKQIIASRIFDRSLVTETCDPKSNPKDSQGNSIDNIDFVKTLSVYIRKAGSSKKVRIANYTRTQLNRCGFYMNIDINPATGLEFNLREFLPAFEITQETDAKAPPNDTVVSGFLEVRVDIEVDKNLTL